MRTTRLLIPAALAAAAFALPAGAQIRIRTAPGGAYAYSFSTRDTPRAVVGITTSTTDARDTLGLRITEVAAGSPAEKAGITEGDRLQAINGIDLRLSPIDIGDQEMADAMSRRLTRELGKLKPGDDVTLRIDHDGRTKTVTLKTVDANVLYGNPTGMSLFRTDENRAALGVSLAMTGSRRDTLGILIIGVNSGGPADKAGLEEGDRIAAINGVNLKVDREDAGDSYVAAARYHRLQREMAKVKPGDEVTLQVWAGGRFKTVHVKAGNASELAGNNRTIILNGNGDLGPWVNFNLDRPQIRKEVQRAMQEMRQSLQNLRVESPQFRWEGQDGGSTVIRTGGPPAPPASALSPGIVVAPNAVADMPLRVGAMVAPAPLATVRAVAPLAPIAPAPNVFWVRPSVRVIRF